jgi:pilus assembly protein CpaB
MKTARLVALVGVVAAAGGLAYYVTGLVGQEPQIIAAPSGETVKVLVASGDITVGTAVSAGNLRWQDWPVAATSPLYISERDTPNAMQEWSGAIARASFVEGEPLRAQKLIKGNGSGFLSAILPAGMRAVATKIAVDTAAGGFILPNDRVDVILTRRDADATRQNGGAEAWTTSTILKNIRVLAIDQIIEDQNGQKVITGSTATLELAPRQTETLALSKEIGTLSLTLRSLADSNPNARDPVTADDSDRTQKALAVVRYGVSTTVTNR